MQNKFLRSIDSGIQTLNRIDSRILIFSMLCLSLLSFTLYSNEEAYFSLAKQYVDPGWIPGSFTFTEWVGTRFLFQTIAGFALTHLSFENLAFWGRFCNFLGYAFPLALIFKELKINNLGILVLLTVFIQSAETQHFIGKEWIFLAFEGKTLAYIFVLWGYYFLLADRFLHAALFAAMASWLHILVGGWFFVLVFIHAALSRPGFKLLFQVGIIYLGVILPFILYLTLHLAEKGPVINGVNIDWVYSFYRNPHHTAPMHTVGAMHRVFPRVIVSFCLLLLSLFYFNRIQVPNIQKLNRIALITLCMVFSGLLLTFIDTNGRILKYYVFRIASIGAFSYYLLILLFLKYAFANHPRQRELRALAFALILPFFCIKAGKNVNNLIHPKVNHDLVELTTYASQNTSDKDVFLFLQEDELSFSRLARRELLVIFKFDPGGGGKIYEWYRRCKMREQLREDINQLDAITDQYQLDYLISKSSIEHSHLREAYRNNKYFLYRVVRMHPGSGKQPY